MRPVRLACLVLVIFLPAACGKGGAAAEFRALVDSTAAAVDACFEALEGAATRADVEAIGKRFTEVSQRFQNEMIEFGKRHPEAPPEQEHQALMDAMNRLNEKMTAFSSRYVLALTGDGAGGAADQR